MEESSKSFTPQESLELIGKFILNYRKNLKERSFNFLLWGWLIILASLSHFVIITVLLNMQKYDLIGTLSWINWTFFPAVGFAINIFHKSNPGGKEYTRSHIDSFVRTLWQVTSVAIILELLFCIKAGNYFPTPFILSVVGLSTVVTGSIIKFKPIIYGGILFFLFAITGSFFPNQYQLLINAFAFLLGYLVPGYMLKSSKSE